MAILVDELREYPHTRLPFRHWCHLVSDDSFEELHAFAARIGIPDIASRVTTTTYRRTCARAPSRSGPRRWVGAS